MSIPTITIIGKSGSGKTTLMEAMIQELSQRGYRVGTVKHHSHPGFEIDQPGKDSWRHAQAGSQHVVVAAPDKVAAYRLLERELSLDEVLEQFTDVDVILVEGYRQAGKPTIELVSDENGREIYASPDQLIALVTKVRLDSPAPQFKRDEVGAITDLVEQLYLKQKLAAR